MESIGEDHEELAERLRKTLYYGKLPGTDRPSLPLTDIAVEFFQEASPKPLGKLDPYLAASTSRSACMSAESVMVGMMYVQRLRQRRPDYLTQISSSELFLISMMMASKFLYDEGIEDEVFNDEWAESGDVDVDDVNQMERDFLSAIDWNLFVRPEDFAAMLDSIEKRIARQQGCNRGWFSYTDLCVLAHDSRLHAHFSRLLRDLSKVLCVSSVAYLAGLLTLVGSTMLGSWVAISVATLPSTVLPSLTQVPAIQLVFHPWSMSDNSQLSSIEPLISFTDMRSEVTRSSSENASQQDEMSAMPFRSDSTLPDPSHEVTAAAVGRLIVERETQDLIANKKDRKEGHEKQNVKLVTLENKDTIPIISGLVSSMLTLLTLKDTLVSFVSAICYERPLLNSTWNSNFNTNTQSYGKSESVEVCSDGACMLESWPGCWNVSSVSSEHDWSQYKSRTARESQRQACCDGRQGGRLNPDLSGLGDRYGARNAVGGQKCCCRLEHLMATRLHTSLYPSQLDVGFATRSALPLIITN